MDGWKAARLPLALVALGVCVETIDHRAGMALALTLFMAGIVHGAGEEGDGTIAPMPMLRAAFYVLASLAVAALYLAAPVAGLALFFGLSAWHFGRELDGSPLSGAGLGFVAIGGSALTRPAETQAVLSVLTGSPLSDPAIMGLGAIGLTGAALAFVALGRCERHAVWPFLALLTVGVLPPVLAVATIFVALHAIPVHRRQARAYGWKASLKAAWPATAIAIIGATTIILGVAFDWLVLPVAAALAFGFASPHMVGERLGTAAR